MTNEQAKKALFVDISNVSEVEHFIKTTKVDLHQTESAYGCLLLFLVPLFQASLQKDPTSSLELMIDRLQLVLSKNVYLDKFLQIKDSAYVQKLASLYFLTKLAILHRSFVPTAANFSSLKSRFLSIKPNFIQHLKTAKTFATEFKRLADQLTLEDIREDESSTVDLESILLTWLNFATHYYEFVSSKQLTIKEKASSSVVKKKQVSPGSPDLFMEPTKSLRVKWSPMDNEPPLSPFSDKQEFSPLNHVHASPGLLKPRFRSNEMVAKLNKQKNESIKDEKVSVENYDLQGIGYATYHSRDHKFDGQFRKSNSPERTTVGSPEQINTDLIRQVVHILEEEYGLVRKRSNRLFDSKYEFSSHIPYDRFCSECRRCCNCEPVPKKGLETLRKKARLHF